MHAHSHPLVTAEERCELWQREWDEWCPKLVAHQIQTHDPMREQIAGLLKAVDITLDATHIEYLRFPQLVKTMLSKVVHVELEEFRSFVRDDVAAFFLRRFEL